MCRPLLSLLALLLASAGRADPELGGRAPARCSATSWPDSDSDGHGCGVESEEEEEEETEKLRTWLLQAAMDLRRGRADEARRPAPRHGVEPPAAAAAGLPERFSGRRRAGEEEATEAAAASRPARRVQDALARGAALLQSLHATARRSGVGSLALAAYSKIVEPSGMAPLMLCAGLAFVVATACAAQLVGFFCQEPGQPDGRTLTRPGPCSGQAGRFPHPATDGSCMSLGQPPLAATPARSLPRLSAAGGPFSLPRQPPLAAPAPVGSAPRISALGPGAERRSQHALPPGSHLALPPASGLLRDPAAIGATPPGSCRPSLSPVRTARAFAELAGAGRGSQPSPGAPSSSSLVADRQPEVAEPSPDGAGEELGPLCPALIVPQDQATFTVSVEEVLALGARRQGVVEIIGPGGRPLLHARARGESGAAAGAGQTWLELVTTPASPYPHARVGPLSAGARLPEALQIVGPQGASYGCIVQDGSCWRVRHRSGLTALLINVASQTLAMSALDESGVAVASAVTRAPGHAMRVQVEPGADALLVLLCMLAVVLSAPQDHLPDVILPRIPRLPRSSEAQ